MYKHEGEGRKKARHMLLKAGYKAGGHVKAKCDEEVEEGVHQHEAHDHKGEPKTKLKLARGGCADGMAGGGRLDKKSRGKKKGGNVTVNVILPGEKDKQPVPVPVPAPQGAAPKPPMPPPQGAPAPGGMAPGMPPGGPPMMHKKGGKVNGPGKVPGMSGGGGGGKGRQEKADHLPYATHGGRGRV